MKRVSVNNLEDSRSKKFNRAVVVASALTGVATVAAMVAGVVAVADAADVMTAYGPAQLISVDDMPAVYGPAPVTNIPFGNSPFDNSTNK